MIFNVLYSFRARQDLRDIYEYIAYELLEPGIAAGQVNRIMKAARSLEQMPMRCRCYEGEPWCKMGLRFLHVDNYLIFYLPDENNNIVNVIRIMYAGRDVTKQLNEIL